VAAGLCLPQAAAQTKLPAGPDAPGPHEVVAGAVTRQEAEGSVYHLRGSAYIETTELRLSADELDYDEETGEAEARGQVHFLDFERGQELWADKVEYNLQLETGKFYNVRGSSPAKIDRRAGLLATTNPFYFQGLWAERLREKYILHSGFITNCRLPKPWWTLRGPKFDIIPNQRALAYHSVFRLRFVPLFYAPVFYKSLAERPRRSGFLTPNIGNSSRRGKMVGAGYFWAINRSYDAAYRTQLFTQRGIAHHVDFRGKPTAASDFNLILYGVNDRGLELENGDRLKEGGLILSFDGHADLGHGFSARVEGNYLSSMRFRRAFTESFNEAISSEVHTTGFVEKHWSSYGLSLAFARLENIQNTGEYDPESKQYLPDEKIVIRKLPELAFVSRDRQIWRRGLPVWVSLESSAGLVRRNQPLFQTRQFLERIDFQPRVMTAIRWKGFNLLPSFSIRETQYDSRQEQGRVSGANIARHAREFTLELVPPSLARTFDGPHWLGGKVKHVIEPRAVFRHAAGIDDFDKLIRFDETELLSNTTEAEFSLTNRFYVKRGSEVTEVMSWQLWQSKYFDPSFGGAVSALDPVTGQPRRNVVLSSLEVTPFAFLDGPRHYSPVVSALRLDPVPGFGVEWRADYDPLRHRLVNGELTADWRHSIYYLSLGHRHIRSVPQLSPAANQFRGRLVVGNDNRRGWNTAFDAVYDYRIGVMQYATTQVTYNSDCCGFSVQYRRFSLGTRNENQFRVAFTVANIGAFGTLKKQERLF
jgi:LPS-assembly protein